MTTTPPGPVDPTPAAPSSSRGPQETPTAGRDSGVPPWPLSLAGGLPRPAGAVLAAAAEVGGAALGAAAALAARARQARPLHPRGRLAQARLVVDDDGRRTGIDILDTPGEHDALIRTSRALGLPAPLPDIPGVALRIVGAGDHGIDPDTPNADGDLLFAGTGLGRADRFVLAMRSRLGDGALTTLLPVHTETGAVVLALVPLGDVDTAHPSGGVFELRAATPLGDWQRVGRIIVGAECPEDPEHPVRFDAVDHPPRGVAQYPLVRALRAPAYALARTAWRGHETEE